MSVGVKCSLNPENFADVSCKNRHYISDQKQIKIWKDFQYMYPDFGQNRCATFHMIAARQAKYLEITST